jgi:hypothetical protein
MRPRDSLAIDPFPPPGLRDPCANPKPLAESPRAQAASRQRPHRWPDPIVVPQIDDERVTAKSQDAVHLAYSAEGIAEILEC